MEPENFSDPEKNGKLFYKAEGRKTWKRYQILQPDKLYSNYL